MTIMAATSGHVTAGVDTHGDEHVASVYDSSTARKLAHRSFPTTLRGYAACEAWIAGHGVIDAVGVESTGSWGAGLTRFLLAKQVRVIEVDRPDRKARRFEGKSDPSDADAAARAVISGRATGLPKTRDGAVEAIRTIEVVCHGATKDRTRALNQFRALIVTAPDSLRDRLRGRTLVRQYELVRRMHSTHDNVVEHELRIALKELVRRIEFLDEQIDRLEQRMHELTAKTAPALAGMFGVGPHVAAQLLVAAGDNPHRMTSEARFAKLCGACPIPASSGKTQRHRLNRGGDRRANNALHTIVLVRMQYHQATRDYVARRRAEGKTTAEITRCLKRFVARDVYQAILHPPADLITGTQLRALRHELGITLTAMSTALDVRATTLSKIERSLHHDTNITQRAHHWLQNTA